MGDFKFTYIIFGLWIGFLLTGSAVVELWQDGQIYSNRTFKSVLTLFIAAVCSSAFSWVLFSRSQRSNLPATMVLAASNFILFLLFGILVSYVVIVLPLFFESGPVLAHHSFTDLLRGIFTGILGAGFSFKTFGLPLLWPGGALAGFTGTLVFVTVNKKINCRPRH